MKNIDLSYFNNKDLGELIKYGDELFNSKIEDKIHAHKVYVTVLNQLPRIFKFLKTDRISKSFLKIFFSFWLKFFVNF